MSRIRLADIARNDAACMMRAPFMFVKWVFEWRSSYGDPWMQCVRVSWAMAEAYATPWATILRNYAPRR